MRRFRNVCLIALGSAVGLVLLVGVAWAVDSSVSDGKVARNTKLAGRSVGGLRPSRLTPLVADVAEDYRTSPVVIDAPDGGFTTNARDLGLSLDPGATERAAMRVGRTGSFVERLTGWARSFVTSRRVPVQVKVDERAVRAIVAEKDPGPRTPPVEPTVKAKSSGSGFTIVEGKSGKGIDPRDIVKALPTAAASGGPVRVKVKRGDVPPTYAKSAAESLLKRAEKATAKPLEVTAGLASATIAPGTLRSWVRSEPGRDRLELTVDQKQTAKDLARVLSKANVPAKQLSFTVQGGVPVAKPGTPGTACCAEDAPDVVAGALFGGDQPDSTVRIPMKVVQPAVPASDIPKLGVKELVGTFTTNYPAGQPRVTNIHRMADAVKGTLIPPGSTFSLNGTVGQRTLAKGYVVDRQINDKGEFDEAVGGGVSQFATTAFNAAFFAGLDFGEYQSHTIYINRYPYGREATVSWQHPDLQMKNTTPYGVVIWASYSNTSVTVSLYSTKVFSSVVQSGQTTAPFGPGCTRVVTERTRKYLDGRPPVTDKFYALYQPEEGKKCR